MESRTEVLRAWGDWLTTLGKWQWFVTLTFRDPAPNGSGWTAPGWAYATRAYDEFVAFVRPALGELTWVRAFELQRDRGVPHIHALVGGLDRLQYEDASRWFWKRYGFNRILEYDPSLGAAHYLTKYVVKELGHVDFSPSIRRTS